jgi:putative nucleotidyltransferase with HDIG domain
VAGAILVLKQVRTRTRLLFVGFAAAVVGFFTTIGVGIIDERSWTSLLTDGFTVALWSIIAGSLMTVMLPTVEKMFGVETDLSLIELGDPAHPLLQELIRRAPGTYNHSITVASLAEAAAESIGARGLLVRVGAYFHDIGKMLKPQYFIENQSKGDNRHDSLVPAMSTLVIIAHVKDGADLARQNRLPDSIIDFIQQHHGTTLVEYFYRQANQKKVQEDPDSGALDESSFRYPGPKPQTREAGVLMLADAVESASRVLKEPTASRIENLVHEISMKRLLDGQFDESGLTLEDIRKIGESLVKSLTAVYHGRVKYPDQETA